MVFLSPQDFDKTPQEVSEQLHPRNALWDSKTNPTRLIGGRHAQQLDFVGKKIAKTSLNVSKTFWPWRNLDQIHHKCSLRNLSDTIDIIAPDCSWKEDIRSILKFFNCWHQDWRLNGGSKFLKGVRLFGSFQWADDGDDDRKRVVNLNEQYELGERKITGKIHENSIECFWLPRNHHSDK